MKHDNTCFTIYSRRKGDHAKMEEIETPASVGEYSKYRSGVDQMDQKIFYYPCTRNTLKQTKTLFFYLMKFSVHSNHVPH